jgi:hypothetical protein
MRAWQNEGHGRLEMNACLIATLHLEAFCIELACRHCLRPNLHMDQVEKETSGNAR